MRAPFAPLYRLTVITALLCSAASLSAQTGVETLQAPVVKPMTEGNVPAQLDAVVAPDAPTLLARPAGAPAVARRAPLAPLDAAPRSPALAPIDATDRLVQPEARVEPEKTAAPAAPRTVDAVEPVVP
jgi:hypothetical protein